MEKLITLDIDNIYVSSTVLNAKKPDYIYVPLLKNSKILVSQNEVVQIGTPIIKSNEKTITSSISGTIKSIKKVNTIDGMVDAIEIENNYEENYLKETKTKHNSSLNSNILEERLKYYNYDLTNIDTLILNCIDDEPYVLSENFYLYLYYEDFLDLLDRISKTYKLSKVMICLKASASININNLLNHIGMYPNINLEIVPDLYLLGKEEFLLNHFNLVKETSLVIKAYDFYNLYNDIKKNRPATDKLITISGNNIDKPSIIRVKIGSDLKFIINDLFTLKKNNIYIAGGLMQGHKVNLDNFIVTANLDSLLIMKDTPDIKPEKCLNCGVCSEICPRNLNPILLNNPKYHEKMANKCFNCGLCSYICPSHIKFNIERND